MTYEEFKGELFRIIMQQEAVQGRKIMLLEKGYTAQDDQMLSMIRYINKVTRGREDSVMHGDYLQVIWGEGNIRSIMSWNVREYFERYKSEGWQGILPDLLVKIQRCGRSTEWLQLEEGGYEKTKSKLVIRPVNYYENRYELEDGIYNSFGDIALTLYGVIYDAADDYLTMKMKREITDTWKKSDKELLADAMRNTEALMPPRLYRSTDFRTRHDPEEGIFMPEGSVPGERKGGRIVPMLGRDDRTDGVLGYRLTTTKSINGAIAAFYPGVKERLGELLGDYYLGFTSIHEAIIHPIGCQSPLCMKESIRGINAVFPRDEMLSNRVYRYFTEKSELVEV